MEQVIKIIVDNGVSIGCLIYFMWYNNTTLKEFTNQMLNLNLQVQQLLVIVTELQKAIKKED